MAEGRAERPTGFDMPARETNSRHTRHADGRTGKTRPDGPEFLDYNPCGFRSRKKHAGNSRIRTLCLMGRF